MNNFYQIIPQPTEDYTYQIGGSLSNDSPSYVVRQADYDLYNYLRDGEFCYVLTSRQMGKSSLRIRVKDKLQSIGFNCVSLDLSRLGSENISSSQWYKGVIFELCRGLNLLGKVNLKEWLNQLADLSPVQLLISFFEEIILPKVEGKIVIFIDEIDSVLSLNFPSDDFFALIRFCYNQRAENSEYNRLNFSLFGVTTSSQLINDPRRTPFNIGRKIDLNGFQLHEVTPLVKGLEGTIDNPEAIIKEILRWTNGQPLLTQKLCKLVWENKLLQKKINQGRLKQDIVINNGKDTYLNQLFQEVLTNHSAIAIQIENLVQTRIIDDWENQDQPVHLRTISDRLLYNQNKTEKLLTLYQNIITQGSVTITNSWEENELILSGLIIREKGQLKVKNKIYQIIFDQIWVENKLSKLKFKKCINCQEICQYFLDELIAQIPNLKTDHIDKLLQAIAQHYPEKILQLKVDQDQAKYYE